MQELKILPIQNEYMTDDEFFEFCRQNRAVKFERNPNGEIIFGMPTGAHTGRINMKISTRLGIWSEQDGTGEAFDSSTGFKLPNKATRSPDAAWLSHTQWNRLSEEEKKRFPPVCPDFVIEICSENDTVSELMDKMTEYIENGCRLGWLIDPNHRKAYIYRPNQEVEVVDSFDQKLSGEQILKGFELDLMILR